MPDFLDDALESFSTQQLGYFGEETARAYFEERDVPIVDMDGGVGAHGFHGLDLTIVLDGEYLACEVKARWRGRDAGRLTRDGNLPKPRLRRAGARLDGLASHPQVSDAYVLQRVTDDIDVDDETLVGARLLVIDLRARRAQLYDIDDGRVSGPSAAPEDCSAEMMTAYATLHGDGDADGDA